jgi:hypothetical protein
MFIFLKKNIYYILFKVSIFENFDENGVKDLFQPNWKTVVLFSKFGISKIT